jgi:hypothetical protein
MIGRATFILAVLCSIPLDAISCSTRGPGPTDSEIFAQATEVFVARVTSTELARFSRRVCAEEAEQCEYVRASYTVIEQVKGRTPRRGHVKDVTFGPGNCSLGLLAGWYYVFYISDEYRSVLHPGGSFAVGPDLDPERLDELRSIGTSPHNRPQRYGY